MIEKLFSRLMLFAVIGFAAIVVLNRGFVFWQWGAIWSSTWFVGGPIAYAIAVIVVGLFLILFPVLYLWFGKTIVLWSVIRTAWQYITKQLMPSFLTAVCDNTWQMKESMEAKGLAIKNIWNEWLGDLSRPVRKALKMGMKRVPVIHHVEEIIGSVDLNTYASKEELQADLQQRLEPYLEQPAGGGVGKVLLLMNVVCLVVVWGVLAISG